MIQYNPEKVKRGQCYLLNGETVWVERQDSETTAYVFWSKERKMSDRNETVLISELKPVKKFGSSIKQVVKPVSKEERERRETLNEFFDRIALKIPFHCMNCGKPLYAFNKKAKRAVSAHLFPKSIFESIATDENNIVFMGSDYIGCPCFCHDRYDSNSDTRKGMPIYQVVLERFQTDLRFKMTPQELKQAYTYLALQWE